MIQKLVFTGLLLLLFVSAGAQTAALRGIVTDSDNNAVITDASVVLTRTGRFAATNNEGRFSLTDLPAGTFTLIVSHAGFLPREQEVTLTNDRVLELTLTLERDPETTNGTTTIPTITLDEAEAEGDGLGEIANLLNASRDIFQRTSSFGWSVFRFRERGYDSEFFPVYLNGIPINDPESGITFYGEFGGLNDVLRNRQSVIGMDAADFAFSEIGGASSIDTRASTQRKQIRASYAISNRTYTNRMMLTASTGVMPGGWAVSISGSRRWAQEGWWDGTFFDGYAYFLSVDKKFNDKHALNLTFLGSPNSRGRTGDTFQEMYDLAGSTRYNPYWGYWNGEKRNGYVSHSHQPIAILRYDLKPSRSTNMTLATYAQFGQNGYTRLDWFNAQSPEPDYNRRLPSALEDPEQAGLWADLLANNESLRQINWVAIWEANTINTEIIEDANGIPGNTISGKRSQYVIADFRGDSREAGFNGVLRQNLGERFVLNAGSNYLWYRGRNFKTVDDILGGDFIVDWDRFAQQDIPDDPTARDNDLRTTNHIIREGETYGYNYDENIRKAGAWVQVQGTLNRFSVFAGAENLYTKFWRTGHMQNGRFPDESLGDSKKQSFNTYGLKAGITYKISGRHFLYANGFYGTRAPLFRDLFLSPRSRNQTVEGAKPYTVSSAEGGYIWRAPNYKARLTGFLTEIKGEYDNYLFYAATTGVFGSVLQTGIDRRHAGLEMAIEARPFVGWAFTAAANLGEYIYTSRPTLFLTLDNTSEVILDGVTVYQKNFYVPRTPQTTASASVRYEGKQFWFASLTLNWADNSWFLFDPTRRTAGFVEPFERGSELWHLIIDQQKAPAAYTLDFFGGKSWRINRKYYVYLNVGVNNILNNLDIITSGRDAYRNAYRNEVEDQRLYSSQIYYAPGTNYFISLALRI
ncbi:MAG: TonB-dependent receptor [Bacteroidetes bacterium]|nr:MAG: TonB-dependent receptor [Bacteroidota bacterium]